MILAADPEQRRTSDYYERDERQRDEDYAASAIESVHCERRPFYSGPDIGSVNDLTLWESFVQRGAR